MAQVGTIVIVSVILLDIFDIWDRIVAPEHLSHIACSLLPLTKPIWPITYNHTIASAYAGCAGVIGEPIVSLIFLMLKMSIAIAAVVPYWGLTIIFDDEFHIAEKQLFAKFDKPNGLREQIQFNTAVVLMILVLCWAMFRTILSGNYETMLSAIQKPIEDMIAALTYVFFITTTLFAVVVAKYFLQARHRT